MHRNGTNKFGDRKSLQEDHRIVCDCVDSEENIRGRYGLKILFKRKKKSKNKAREKLEF